VYAEKDAPPASEAPPIEAKPAEGTPIEGLPVLSERQVADPSPEAHAQHGRRARKDGLYPRQSLNRSIRRPGGTTRLAGTPRGRISKRVT
ncbi:MAG: hypothetical protein WBN01_14115, partial [Polyangiales bacterium]